MELPHALAILPRFDARYDDIDSHIERFERITEISGLEASAWAVFEIPFVLKGSWGSQWPPFDGDKGSYSAKVGP